MNPFQDLIPGNKTSGGAFSDLVPGATAAPTLPTDTITGLPQTKGGNPLSFATSLWNGLADLSHGAAKGAIKGVAETASLATSGGGLIQKGLDATANLIPGVNANTAAGAKQGAADLSAAANLPTYQANNPTEKVGSVIGQIADALVTPPGGKAATLAVDTTKAGAGLLKDTLVGTAEQQAAMQAGKAAEAQAAVRARAIKDATPAYDKSLIGEPAVNGVPRVQEGGGVTKVRTVTSTKSEIAAGDALYKVPGYAEAKTSLEKFNIIEPEIARQGQALQESLKAEKVLRPPAEVYKLVDNAVNKASQDSLLLQKADPAVKNYLRVASRAIKQADGTLDGELKVRQALDNAYDDAGGKYMNNKGLDQIHRAARNALNDDMEAKALNTEVKASLRAQSDLYKAADVLQDKARAEGGSAIEQLIKAHPIVNKVTQAAIKTAGLGAGLHLIP